MSNHPGGGDDLTALIRQAEGEVSRQKGRAEPARSKLPLGPVLGLITLIVAGCCVYSIWAQLAPPSPDKVARDLDFVIEAARVSVEKSKSETGQLPEALPSASLGPVVRYERGQGDYQLSATILGVRVTLAQDGKKTVEKGVQQ